MKDRGEYGRHLREVVDSYRKLPESEQRVHSRRLNGDSRRNTPLREADRRPDRER